MEPMDIVGKSKEDVSLPKCEFFALLDDPPVLGFGEYIEEVYAAYEQHKLDTLDSPKGGKFSGIEMTEEEALAEQQRMFAEARARMNNGVSIQKQPEADNNLES
ncbi:hypothetical protein C4D60_Mb01t23630 [Musa balbisiana]|uniref:Uncharacterized protein n=1 Tax=Musa balbisiana TaxID=52838 RepID=A0A4S8JPG8_MUSBA|nr:hypothetical protein C4D60_Mb01t23630 [Musa balbisiana]